MALLYSQNYNIRNNAKKFWNLVRAAGLPSIIVVNKVDRDRADFQMALDGLSGLNVKPVVLGGAGLVMFGMVAATGIRILAGVDFKHNRFNAMIVAISVGIGMIPLIAPNFKQWMPHGVHPLIESGILLSSIAAVLLNLFYNGAREDTAATIAAAKQAEAH